MGRNNHDNNDLRKYRRLLRETTRLAERASMTGSLQGGGRIAIRQYNAIRNHLQDSGIIPEDLFQELDEDEATFDELGVVTGMLDSYLEDDDEAGVEAETERGLDDGESRRGRRWKRHGPWGPEAAQFWGNPQALRDLQQLGEEMREHLPELLKMRDMMRGPHPPTPPTPPAPPVPPTAATPGTPPVPGTPAPPQAPAGWEGFGEQGARPFGGFSASSRGPSLEVAARIRQISEEMQREDLDFSRRLELSRELADLAGS
jgi:hypothetical protein